MSFQPPKAKRGFYYIVNLGYDLEFKMKEIIKKNPKISIDCYHCEGMGCNRCNGTGRKNVRSIDSLVDATHFYVGDEEHQVDDNETVDRWFTRQATNLGGEELGSGGGFGLRDIDFMFRDQDSAISYLKMLCDNRSIEWGVKEVSINFDSTRAGTAEETWYHAWERKRTGDRWIWKRRGNGHFDHQCDGVCQSLFQTCGLMV